ncbi:hypothetical protein B0H17DRAFT_1182032 [Mycena rosella]|uniref:Zn(2)-C6 fungal-type domain-containing protein n=1 Tax=Mycena rosella TaxID=1033263 RepID=A0AAD7GEF0_MYCRO|nr:hypothetical protein B0H17DRAFT_1182032 [Mycena rosella]
MPTPREKRRPKPPACDFCKSRRVLCHPQPNGAPCPRCAEKNIVCTTTPVARGRPRKNPITEPESPPQQGLVPPASSSSSMTVQPMQVIRSPDLTPELVAHFFQCFDHLVQVINPLIGATSISMAMRIVSFQLHLLPPQSKVLALCIMALSSLVSYHEAMLGDGPRPTRYTMKRSLRPGQIAALRAAWECGIIIEVSTENAASCFLLDLLAQADVCGTSRPWASAYISHTRALTPMWRTSSATPAYASNWAGFLMIEALVATRGRKAVLITRDDQLILCGEQPTAEALLASLEAGAAKPGTAPVFQAMRPYMFHVTCSHVNYGRRSPEQSDYARLSPVSEGAVMQFLASLSIFHTILSFLLERGDAALVTFAPGYQTPFFDDEDGLVRRCMSGLILGFVGLALPLHRELEYRMLNGPASHGTHKEERMDLLRAQAREMTALGVRLLARSSRYLPPIHYFPLQWNMMRDYALFALDDAEMAGVLPAERLRDLETWVLSDSPFANFRLDEYLDNARASVLFDPDRFLAEMFLL